MIQIIINIPGQELQTYEVKEAVIITHSDEGDCDFDGNASPAFIKKIISKRGLEKFMKYRVQALLEGEREKIEKLTNPFYLVSGQSETP